MAVSCSRPGQRAIDRRSRNREQLRQVADRIFPRAVHAAQLLLLFLRELRLLTPELSLGAGDRHAFAGPHADQVRLEFGEGGQDVEEHLAHGVGRGVATLAEGQGDAARDQGVRNMTGIGNGACQSIELRHHQRVATAHGGERLVEAWPEAVRPGESVVGVDPFRVDAEFDQRGALRREILLVGGTACVADQGFAHGKVYVKGAISDKVIVPAK